MANLTECLPENVAGRYSCSSALVILHWGAIGGRGLVRECSQSLGQKNTTFTIFLALTYGRPLIALGPTCYVIWHNLWNAWQLHQMDRE
jgi:hypothetical protein